MGTDMGLYENDRNNVFVVFADGMLDDVAERLLMEVTFHVITIKFHYENALFVFVDVNLAEMFVLEDLDELKLFLNLLGGVSHLTVNLIIMEPNLTQPQ